MRLIHMKTWLAAFLFAALCGSLSAQHWYDYAPPPTEFDWQFFAPLDESWLDSGEISPVSSGYFFNLERMNLTVSRPERAPIGNNTGPNPVSVYTPNEVDYAYYDLTGNLPTTPTSTSPLTLLAFSDGGSFGFQFNSITDATPRTSSGWGNRFDIGWMSNGGGMHHGGSTGWMLSVLTGVGMNDVMFYGFDDKRLDQLAAAQGLDGIDGNTDDDLLLGAPVNPVAPVDGIPSIPAADGLSTVNMFFSDPFNLLLGFVDINGDQIPDDLNGNGTIGDFGSFPGGDQVRLGVVFDNMQVTYQTKMSGTELMAVQRKKTLHGGAVAEMFVGARYLQLRDRLSLQARGGVLANFEVDNNALNRIVGPQFGIRVAKQTRRWSTSVSGRFMAGANFVTTRQIGFIGDHLSTSGAGNAGISPGLPLAFGGNQIVNTFRDRRFSPTGELRIQGSLHLFKGVALQAAWNAFVVGGVSRGANTVNYSLPSLGIIDREDLAFAQGISFGFEINR